MCHSLTVNVILSSFPEKLISDKYSLEYVTYLYPSYERISKRNNTVAKNYFLKVRISTKPR